MALSCIAKVAVRARMGAAVVFALVGALLVGVAPAYAYYGDAATTYPASQDLVITHDIIYASEIPDGEYVIPAKTTSYMCVIYDPYTGARDTAHLNIKDGSMTVVFMLSNAYNAIYFGEAEDAAALAGEEATEPVGGYVMGDPPTGYTQHRYVVSLSVLNDAMTIATYSGGQSIADGKWYTRQAVFFSSDEIERAVAAGGTPEDPPSSEDPPPSADPTSSADPTPSANPTPSESPAPSATPAPTPAPTTTTTPSTATTAQPQQTPTAAEAETTVAADEGDDAAALTAAPRRHGTLFTIATLDDDKDEGAAQASAPVSEERGFVLPVEALLGIGIAALVVIGILARTLKFRHDLDNPSSRRS